MVKLKKEKELYPKELLIGYSKVIDDYIAVFSKMIDMDNVVPPEVYDKSCNVLNCRFEKDINLVNANVKKNIKIAKYNKRCMDKNERSVQKPKKNSLFKRIKALFQHRRKRQEKQLEESLNDESNSK